MTWFKVDDNLAFHSKTLIAGNAAMGLWVRAGSWSAQHLTEGFVPWHIVDALGTRKQAGALVRAGLWTSGDEGCQFWQWSEEGRQPTRESVLTERAAARERQRRAREKAAASRRDGSVTDGVTEPVVTVPPSRPVPTSTTQANDVRPVLETDANDGMDGYTPGVDYSKHAAALGVDFEKVRKELARRVRHLSVPPEVVYEGIVEVLERAKRRKGDRTGLILTSLDTDWAQWERLVEAAA